MFLNCNWRNFSVSRYRFHAHIHIAAGPGRAFDARAEHDDQRHAETLTDRRQLVRYGLAIASQ